MQTDQNWTDNRLDISRQPHFQKSTLTAAQDNQILRCDIERQTQEFLANGGTITHCPPMTITTDEELAEFRRKQKAEAIERNVREAA